MSGSLGKYIYFFFILIAISCKPEVKEEKIAMEIFFRNPEQFKYSISPDGKFISFLQPYQGKLNVFIRSLESDSIKRITSFTDQSVQYYFWAGNNHILYGRNSGAGDNFQLFSSSKDGKHTIKIAIKPTTKVEFIDHLENTNKYILLAMNERVPENFDVYKLDVETGEKVLIEKNPGNFVKWMCDHDGVIRLAVGSDGVTETLYYRAEGSKDFKAVKSCNFINTLKPYGFTGEKDHIYALSNLKRDKLALVDFNCATGKEVKVIYENPDVDIMDIAYSKALNKLNYITYENSRREMYFLNEDVKQMYDHIRLLLQGQEVKIIDNDNKEEHFILKTYTDRNPGAYYLYTKSTKVLEKLGDINPAINPDYMSKMQDVTYKSRDGLTIHGYLTLPMGKSKKNLPVVVLPHSDPYSRNTWGYSAEVQFLANRGYAVFQMNYRGSTGYGKKFRSAGFKEWSKKVQYDITDGVKWLIGQGIGDPERIAIYGYSFGGFSALNQVIYNPDMYVCAASYSGLINLFTYLKGFPAYYKPYSQMLDMMIGNPETDIEYLKQSSPIFQIDKVKVPLLIAQGGKDPKVNVSETNQFVKELRKRKVPVNYIVNDNEGHAIDEMKNKLNFYSNLESFLDKNLKQPE